MNIDKFPKEVIEYAHSVMEGFEYADCLRICEAHNKEQIKEYEKARNEGCCGSINYEVFKWDGKEYWFGFNYGH